MKQDYRLRTASLLMSLSILLLVMLQAYWLRNAWFDEYRRLKRELTVLLRETVAQQEMQQFILLNGDGAPLDSVFFKKYTITG